VTKELNVGASREILKLKKGNIHRYEFSVRENDIYDGEVEGKGQG